MAILSRSSDLLLYGGAVLLLVVLAISQQERADAPAAPPPVAGDSALAAAGLGSGQGQRLPRNARVQASGTAFSVSDTGVWITARHVVAGCRRAAILTSPGHGALARVASDKLSDVAVLVTQGGAPPLPVASPSQLRSGQIAFHPGFPRGQAGEVASRFLGRYRLPGGFRGAPPQAVQAWAEVGRTDGLEGSLAGLSGAPVLDAKGEVVGVTLAESPRRGRIYAAPRPAISTALAAAGQTTGGFAEGQPVTTDNYGRTADALRRALSIAQVVCLT